MMGLMKVTVWDEEKNIVVLSITFQLPPQLFSVQLDNAYGDTSVSVLSSV